MNSSKFENELDSLTPVRLLNLKSFFRNNTYLIKDILDDVILEPSKLYDIVIHIRLDDFNGRPDFIEFEYYEKLFSNILETYDNTIRRIGLYIINTGNYFNDLTTINFWKDADPKNDTRPSEQTQK